MRHLLLSACVILIAGCASGEEAEPDRRPGPPSLVTTIGSEPATFEDVLATWSGAPFNRVRIAGRRMVAGKLEQLQFKAASDSALVPGTYQCGDKTETGMIYLIGDEAYIDDATGAACSITLTQFTAKVGEDVAGTFTATLVNDKTAAKLMLMGNFRGKITSSD